MGVDTKWMVKHFFKGHPDDLWGYPHDLPLAGPQQPHQWARVERQGMLAYPYPVMEVSSENGGNDGEK